MSNEEIENIQGKKTDPIILEQGSSLPISVPVPVKKQKIIKKKNLKGIHSLGRLKKTSYQSEKNNENNEKKEEMIEEEIDLTPNNCVLPLKMEKIIQKIPIVNVEKERILEGCFGHSTIIFKRPIIPGLYYMEFKPLPFMNSP